MYELLSPRGDSTPRFERFVKTRLHRIAMSRTVGALIKANPSKGGGAKPPV